MAGRLLLMQLNGRAKDYLATDGEVPNRDAGKLPETSVKNGSTWHIAGHRLTLLVKFGGTAGSEPRIAH